MLLHVIAPMSFIAILAHGGGNNRCGTTTRPIPTLSPTTPCPTAVVSTPLKPTGGIFERPGQFVYQTHGPSPVKMIYFFADPVLPSGPSMFSIQCGTGAPYQTNWIDPIPGPDDHDRLIAGAKAACPLAGIGPGDFTVFKLDQRGRVITSFGGKDILLERVWHPFYPGTYNSEPGSPLEMHYNVSMDGTVAVILSCATSGTGFKKFKLEGTGIGNPYKLEPMEGGETLKDLVDTLKWVCPDLPEEYFLINNYQTGDSRAKKRFMLLATTSFLVFKDYQNHHNFPNFTLLLLATFPIQFSLLRRPGSASDVRVGSRILLRVNLNWKSTLQITYPG